MYETDDKEEAREALTLKQAQLNGLEDIYEEMVEEVDFSRDVMDSLVPEREVVPSGGGDVERPSSNREWVLEAVRELDEPRDEDVVEWVDERVGLSEEQVFKILDGLCMDGEVIRKRGGFLEIV